MKALFFSFLLVIPSIAESSHELKAGDIFEIVQTYETSSETAGSGTSSSRGKSALIERVVRVDQDGVELEYDEAPAANGKPQDQNWQLPARIYRPTNGMPILLNLSELEKRVDPWLKKAKMSRDACEQWIFTWNAFKIECDPASALGIVEQYNLWLPNLAEGQPFLDSSALAAVPLKIKSSGHNGTIYVAELKIDPEKVKLGEAETAVVVGKITGEMKSFEEALAAQKGHEISGMIFVTIETDDSGRIKKQTKVTTLRVVADGQVETSTNAVTLERRLLAAAN